MKIKLQIVLLLFQIFCFAQFPNIKSDYEKDSLNSYLEKFSKNYDFVMAYTKQSYWNGNAIKSDVLVLKDNKWSLWNLSSNFIEYVLEKSGATHIDTIKIPTFRNIKMRIKTKKVDFLLNELNKNDFWILDKDSLNNTRIIDSYAENGKIFYQKAEISDGVNYRFDVFMNDKNKTIQSYEPDYFIFKFPEMIDRKKFIMARDLFEKFLKEN